VTRRFTDDTAWQEQAAQAHRDVFGAVRNPDPASTMLYAGGLIGDGFLVEIEAQAVVEP
jgi:enamine deaminase RidA (YjgF/YER057c/UK114 family)